MRRMIAFKKWTRIARAALVPVFYLLWMTPADAQPATIQSIVPSAAPLAGDAFTLKVNGANFDTAAVVRWNGAARPTARISSAALTAAIPASDLTGLHNVEISVIDGSGNVSNTAMFSVYRQIDLPAKDLVYDRHSRRLYASLPPAASVGNSVISIDPFTGIAGTPVLVGSDPGKLALSDDGQYLYVALDGAGAVRRFDLVSQTAGPQFVLGFEDDLFSGAYPYYVNDLLVLPGMNSSVAVSRKFLFVSPEDGGTAIYDNGVRRPVEVPRHTYIEQLDWGGSASSLYPVEIEVFPGNANAIAVSRRVAGVSPSDAGVAIYDDGAKRPAEMAGGSYWLEFSGSSATLYSTGGASGGLNTMTVDGSGVQPSGAEPLYIATLGGFIEFADGKVYGHQGAVVDPAAPTLLGTFPANSSSVSVVPDSAMNRVFFLRSNSNGSAAVIQVFDKTSYVLRRHYSSVQPPNTHAGRHIENSRREFNLRQQSCKLGARWPGISV